MVRPPLPRRPRIAHSGCQAAVLVALVTPAFATAQPGKILHCSPAVQYVCDRESCGRSTEGFQHAESFTYDPGSRVLSACLWTNCYSAKARRFESAAGKETTIVGLLPAEGRPKHYPPVLVSLTIDANRNFVAVWQYTGQGLTFDQGRCNP